LTSAVKSADDRREPMRPIPQRRHPLWLLRLLFPFVVLASGCARYNMATLRADLATGNFTQALATLDKNASSDSRLPYLLERGLVCHYANDFDASNAAFDLAERLSDDLYTRSLSREAAALLTSDNVRPYPGTRYERLLIHYYRALNYVYRHEPDDALVEIRRGSALLQRFAEEDSSFHFGGAAFFAYLAGILYEWADEPNDAYIAYKWAERGYEIARERLGVPPPKELGEALVRLSRQLGFDDEATRYQDRYGNPPSPHPDRGELILFYETGYIPQKEEVDLLFPIFKTDEVDEKRLWEFSETLVHRRDLRVEEATLDYLLRVSVPTYGTNRPRLRSVEASVGEAHATGVLVEDVEAAAQATFTAEQNRILIRTLARSVLKYLAYRRAKQRNPLLGGLVNVFNVMTERADTRSWETLPNQIHLVRLQLPEGEHDVRLTFRDERGNPVETRTLNRVPIRARQKTVLNYRTFQ